MKDPRKFGSSSVSVGEAPSVTKFMKWEVDNSVFNTVVPGYVISDFVIAIPCGVKLDYLELLDESEVQGAAIYQEVGSVASSNATELSLIQQLQVVQDSGEVNNPKRKRWNRLARGRASSSGDTSMGDLLGKRVLIFEDGYRNMLSHGMAVPLEAEVQQLKLSLWQAPVLSFKVKVDAAIDSADNSFGVRVVVRDSLGFIVSAAAVFFPFFFFFLWRWLKLELSWKVFFLLAIGVLPPSL
ncbi:hypothetical protein ACOSQ2_027689 [Xanthoceras sorbifolium]